MRKWIPLWFGLSLAVSACPSPLQSTWPKYHRDFYQTAQSQFSTSATTGTVTWTFDCGGRVSSSPAVADDGTIYVGSGDGNLYAVTALGAQKWKLALGSGGFSSSPAIAADGTIYVGASNGLNAVNSAGSLKWNVPTNGGSASASPAVGFDGTIYIGSLRGTVYAVDPSGMQKWTYDVVPSASIFAAPAVTLNGFIYIGGIQSPYFVALDTSGNLKWQTGGGTWPGNTAAAADGNGNVYVGWQNHVLEARTAAGAFKWLFLTKGNIVGSAPAIASDGTIYFGSMDRNLYALRPNGSEKWEFRTGAGIRGSSPAIGGDGTVYVGSTDGYVYAINADGSLKWRFLTGDTVDSSPAIGADGTVYIGASDHKLYAFGPGPTPVPQPTATPGPLCGNGVIDADEDCDPPNSICPNSAPGFFCSAACQCGCPTTLEFTGIGMGGVVDRGWNGSAHDVGLPSGNTFTVNVTGCAGSSRPCGTCNLTGPVPNIWAANYAAGTGAQIDNRRCTGNTRVVCHGNAGCSGAGTCEYFAGTYVPVSVGGVAVCVEQRYQGAITGTANIETGSIATSAVIAERIYSGPGVRIGCPRCVGDAAPNDGKRGGVCAEGIDAGSSCDVNGATPNDVLGSTSLDCRPNPGALLGTSTLAADNTTGTVTKTLSAASPSCTAVGHTGAKCVCNTCDNAAVTPCSSNADCTAVGASVCGGKRCLGGSNNGTPCSAASACPAGVCGVPGTSTAPNACDGGPLDCVAGGTPGPNDGVCASGPFEQFCAPTGTMIGCVSDSDCASRGLRSCTGGTRDGAVCYPSCVGGLSPGFRCVFDADCGPGGACTGVAAAPTDCPGGTCTFETCTGGRFRECFLDRGQIGGHDDASGQAVVPTFDRADPTLAGLSCVGPTFAGAINSVVGLPGLQRIERTMHFQGRP